MNARQLAAGLALLLVACGDEQAPPQPARFEHPNRVDFVCVLDEEPVQLEHCRNDISGNGLALHALVTQSARGEVAALDLEAREVLDNRQDIPGFTFTPVGEMPVSVVVPPRHPEVTYVANYGSRDIRVLRTRALVSPGGGNPTLRTLRLALDAGDALVVLGPEQSVADRDDLVVIAPTDMVLAPDESALIVAAADAGRVFWLPLQRCNTSGDACDEGQIDEAGIAAIPLQASIDLASTPSAPSAPTPYALLCDYVPPAPIPVAPPALPDPAIAPRPIALTVDDDCPDAAPCTPRVLVADDALPVIHVLDLELLAGDDPESAVLAPLVTGAPTLAVVATPWVPISIDDGGETQFVYAIDARDGSVLALEHGQLLQVNSQPGERPDRIGFQTQAGATALAIVTPDFDPREGADQWLMCGEEYEQDPAVLHGVFLAAAHADGQLRIVDVHDMELRDRNCRNCPTANLPMPAVVRHQARLAQNFLTTEQNDPQPVALPLAEPLFAAEGLVAGVRTNGTTGNPDVPGLDCIACDSSFARAFPRVVAGAAGEDEPSPMTPAPDASVDAGTDADAQVSADGGASVIDPGVIAGCTDPVPALVCGDPDPWTGSGETWLATYEGLVVGTLSGHGDFIPQGSLESKTGALELTADIDFCAAGVLGEEDVVPWYEDDTCDPENDAALALHCRCPDPDSVPDERCPENVDSASEDCVDGDQLVLTLPKVTEEALARLSDDDERTNELTKCQALRDALESDDPPTIGFEIRRVYRDRVVLRTGLAHRGRTPLPEEVSSFEDVEPCLRSGQVAVEVRALNQWTVAGERVGMQHRVRANAAGRCEIDPDADPLHRARARFGCTYRNQSVEFQLHHPRNGELFPQPGTQLRVAIGTPAGKLRVNVASTGFGNVNVVAVQLRYNTIDRRLYLVDVHRRGLVPIELNPVPDFVSASFN